MRTFWRWDLQRRTVGHWLRSPAEVAMIHVALGEYGPALSAFESAYVEHFGWYLPFLRVDPMVDPLRRDPRFQDLLARIDRASSLSVDLRSSSPRISSAPSQHQ